MARRPIRILGLDPGLQHTGWGLIDSHGNRLRHIADGVIATDAATPVPERLKILHDGLMALLALHHPAEAAVEETYVNRNGSAFRLTTLDLSNGIVQTLSDTVDDESPSFAPNGRLIVFATRAQGRDVLMTTTLDGKIKTRLLSSGADMREPAWGPFGR